uniref:SFRICE_029897 n=1 Tax=Spodoptera frugiperda TaxID=7108 RepID=A0A2H1WVK7_SPOFR
MNPIVVQTAVALLLSVPTFMLAIGNTWTSYTLPVLESEDSPIGYPITKSDSNLVSSVIMLGSLTSIVIVGYISDRIGRKKTEILSGLCFVLAWSTIATAKNVTQLVIGRFIIGLGTGLHFVTGVVYIGEISQASIRGALLTIMSFMYNLGTLASYTEGWFCSYEVINYLNLTTAVTFILLAMCLKETPVFLLRIGKEKEAIKSLKFYRGASKVTQEILDEIVYLKSQLINENINEIEMKIPQEKEMLNEENNLTTGGIIKSNSAWTTLRTSISARRALIVLLVQINLCVFMGMIAVQAFAGQFFQQAAPSFSPHLCSVILAIIVTITSGVAVFIVEIIPRRVLMISTCFLSGCCMACLASMQHFTWAPEWGIPLVMILYCVVFQLGSGSIPFIQIAECLPPQN